MTAFIGAGIGYRRRYRAELLEASAEDRPALLEVIPQHFFADMSTFDELSSAFPLVFHEVGLSVGTAAGPADEVSRAVFDRVRALVDRGHPVLLSDHLAMTRSPAGIDLGHLCPLRLTRQALLDMEARVRRWQDALGVPIALENMALPFELQGDLRETAFLCELVESTGCGMLLDLTNLVLNSRNFRFDPHARLEQYPLEAVWQIHLAGGVLQNGFWVDSHNTAVGDLEHELLAQAQRRARNVRAIVVERDEDLPELTELRAEARRAEQVWRQAAGVR